MFMLNQAGRFTCSEKAGVSAVGSVATDRVTQVGQVSSEEPGTVSSSEGFGRAHHAFVNLSRGAHPKIKPWLSRLGVGHAADKNLL